MPSPRYPGLRIECLAPTERTRGDAWLAAVSAFDTSHARLLKEDGPSVVYRTTLLGRDVVIKRWDLAGVASRLKLLTGETRAFRHWRGAAWLSAHHVPTAECLVLLTEYGRGGPRQWLIMEALPGKTVLQHLADQDLTVRQEHAIADALGQQAAALMRHRHYNRDPKPSNQIVTALTDRTATVALIDCVGIKRNLWFDSDEPIPMLARMVIEPMGVGLRPRRTLLMRVLRSYCDAISGQTPRPRTRDRVALKNAWREVAEFIALHGDPTPRINPLSPPQSAPR